MDVDAAVEAAELTKIYGSGATEVRAVDGVSLTLRRGELALVSGPSGSGKTTLLSMLGALLRPTAGRIRVDGVDVTALDESRLPALRARKIGFVFQAFHLLPSLTVEENVLFPSTLVGNRAAARDRALALLERLGLRTRRGFRPRQISGGERQRVAIARALVNDPPVLLADEPTGNLDSQRGQEVMMVLHDVARDEGKAVLIVSHDPRVEDVVDRILWLEDGRLRDRKREPHAWVRDPVCGMRIDEWTATFTTEHAGRRYVFCSERCFQRFTADPDRHAEAAR